ncbi:reverse transcriptase domain-containing protein [Tanacetum coccineum]
MHIRASNSELVEQLPEPERTLNRRNNPPQHPRVVYPPILDINYFRHFLITLQNLYLMDDEPMWAADRVVALISGFAITIPETANEFAIKGNHMTFINGNQFDGRTKTDPHKHIHEFLRICDISKNLAGQTQRRNHQTWDELRTAFISRFFPPTLFDRLLGEIRTFSQHENESLTDAWLRMKEMLRNCHGHNLSKDNIIKIFYHGLNKITQEVLNAAAGGIFLYKTPNQAYELLEDKVLLKLDWAKNQKSKSPLKKIVAFAAEGSSNSDTNKIMARMDAMTMKMDAQAMTLNENSESKSDTEEPPFEKITFNTDYKIKTSLEEPPTDLELKPLLDNLEYVFLEEPSFLPVIISSPF